MANLTENDGKQNTKRGGIKIVVRHILTVLVLLALLVGVPVFASGYPAKLISGADAISSATVILEQPTGDYIVLLNCENHSDETNFATWQTFFEGGEIDYIFEDISCLVAETDAAGLEIAKSFQSRLPENQMTLRTEDATLLFSKVEYGKFDVVLVSQEVFQAYNVGASFEYTGESGNNAAVTLGSKTSIAVTAASKKER